MAFSHSALTVKTNGQTVTVTVYRSGSATATAPLHLTSAVSSAVTQPYAISADTTFYVPDDHAGFWVVSVKQLDGTELWGQEELIGAGEKVIAPSPSGTQLAADAGPSHAIYRAGAISESLLRVLATSNGAVLSTGRMSMVGIGLSAGTVVTSISFCSGTTQASVPLNQWFALFDSSRVLCRQTVDDTTTAWAANTVKTLTLSSPYTTTYSGLHYLGINVVATTVPTILALSGLAVSNGLTPIISGTADSSLTGTAPATASTITATAVVPYAYVS